MSSFFTLYKKVTGGYWKPDYRKTGGIQFSKNPDRDKSDRIKILLIQDSGDSGKSERDPVPFRPLLTNIINPIIIIN